MENLKEKIDELVKLYQSRNFVECETNTKKLIKLNPKVTFLYNLLGLVFTAQKRDDEAMHVYEQGIKLDPKYAMIYNNMALLHYKKSQEYIDFNFNIKKAEELYKKCIELNPKIPEANTNLGNLYSFIQKNEESIKFHKLAILANPKYIYSYINISNVYISVGNFIEAKKYLNDALRENSNFTLAHRELSRINKYKKEDPHFQSLEKLYVSKKIKNEVDKMNLAFALGKANEDIKNFEKSFQYYKEANLIHRSSIKFSLEEEKTYFDEIKKTYNNNLIKKYKNLGFETSSPIFIVGMPRSGTTLVEQILASHSKVYGGEEVFFIPKVINKYFSHDKINLFLQGSFNFDVSNFKKMGEDYINLMKLVSKNSEKTTDKFPPNFLNIGLIKLILPKSKIIHCSRNPRDNIFSIYKNYFASDKITFGSDLKETVEYYNLYKDLMYYWNNLLPDFIYNIKYEDLVTKTEKEIKRLLDFCNLEWEDRCLKFYENKRSISTASDTQVRSKIYSSSVNYWKNYEKFLSKYFKKI